MKIVCYTDPTEKGLLLYYPSASVKAEILHLYKGAKEKYNGYLTVELKKPYKSRTTGKGSQNNLFWKLVQIICDEIGEEPAIVEADLKQKAIAKGFPYHISKISGKPVPESTTKINTVEMAYLIDTAYEVIAFLGIVLEPALKKPADSSEDDVKIADLEKENEQLRNNGFTVSAMTEQQLKVAIEKGEQLEKKVEQAKDIIGDLLFLVITSKIRTINSEEIKDKARQFIKETGNDNPTN